MTHCSGYAAAAVGRLQRISAIGIDAEPDAPLPDGVLDLVATPAERDRLAMTQHEPDSPNWDRLLFSAKEAVYKAWFPLVGEWLEAETVENDRLRLWICFDYGGRAEIVEATRRIVEEGLDLGAERELLRRAPGARVHDRGAACERTDSLRPLGSSQSSWRPSAVRSRK
jgi:hypothetical protein